MKKFKEIIIRFLPLAAIICAICEYKFAPNFKIFKALDSNKPTDIYVYFLGIFALIFTVWIGLSFLWEKARKKLIFNAPIYTSAFILLIIYDYATLKTGSLPLPYFPWFDAILNAIIEDRLMLIKCIYHSLILLFTGYFIGAILGVITGISAGYNKKIRYWIMPIVKVLGPIPSTTYLPIILIVATSLFSGSVFIIALGVWYPVTMMTLTGVINIPKSNFEVAKTFGANNARLIFKVAVPSSMPFIFQGLTQGMAIACTALLVAEMMGVEAGLGWYINWQRGWAEFAKMYAAVIIICLTFLAVNAILANVKRRVLIWKEGEII